VTGEVVASRPRITSAQYYAWQVQDILVGCGLSQSGHSIVGGQFFYVPQVISVVGEPPRSLTVRIFPGQTPDHFAAHAKTIAYNLDMAAVHVVGLGPYLIRLDLVPKTAWT
jgi:hypothetical protein